MSTSAAHLPIPAISCLSPAACAPFNRPWLAVAFASLFPHRLPPLLTSQGAMPGGAAEEACIPLAPGLMDSALVLMYHVGFTVSSAEERSKV